MRAYYARLSPADRHTKFVAGRDPDRIRKADRARYHARKGDPNYDRKRAARGALNRAIKRGEMTRGSCEECGALNAEAHHEDYDAPLDVEWLCPAHHAQLHQVV